MKKRWMILGASVLTVTLLATSVFASSDGYNVYKEALLKTKDVKSAQVKVEMSMKDNGKQLLSGKGNMAMNHDTKDGSGTMSITENAKTHEFEFSKVGKTGVFHELGTDVYMKGNCEGENEEENRCDEMCKDPEQMKNMERLADILLTGVRNQVDLKNADNGASIVTLDMKENQIPETLNILASLKHGNKKHDKMEMKCENMPESLAFLKDMHKNMPEIKSDIKIKAIKLEAKINKEGLIENQVVNCTVTGKDANGTAHEKTVELSMELSNINTAQPKSIDLEGKTVVECKEHNK